MQHLQLGNLVVTSNTQSSNILVIGVSERLLDDLVQRERGRIKPLAGGKQRCCAITTLAQDDLPADGEAQGLVTDGVLAASAAP